MVSTVRQTVPVLALSPAQMQAATSPRQLRQPGAETNTPSQHPDPVPAQGPARPSGESTQEGLVAAASSALPASRTPSAPAEPLIRTRGAPGQPPSNLPLGPPREQAPPLPAQRMPAQQTLAVTGEGTHNPRSATLDNAPAGSGGLTITLVQPQAVVPAPLLVLLDRSEGATTFLSPILFSSGLITEHQHETQD